MLIHSIVSESDIFFTDSIAQPVFRNISGGLLEIDNQNGIRQIKRLYSTNPYLYLDKRYQPYSNI